MSSDVVEIEADSVHGRWLLDREYNTGIIFFRATNASIGLVKLWRERLEIEGAIKGLYINDQAVFNRMTHGHADGRIDLVELEPDEIPDVDERAIRGVYKIQSPIMKPHKLWVSMGTFPLTRFCNGHVFFVNRLPERFGFQTAAVHATYQFADEKTYSFGKRHRLRQAQLWHMDADDYFTKGNFLAVHGDSLMVGVESVFSDKELPVWRGKEYRGARLAQPAPRLRPRLCALFFLSTGVRAPLPSCRGRELTSPSSLHSPTPPTNPPGREQRHRPAHAHGGDAAAAPPRRVRPGAGARPHPRPPAHDVLLRPLLVAPPRLPHARRRVHAAPHRVPPRPHLRHGPLVRRRPPVPVRGGFPSGVLRPPPQPQPPGSAFWRARSLYT